MSYIEPWEPPHELPGGDDDGPWDDIHPGGEMDPALRIIEDGDLADVIALVEASVREDLPGVRSILHHGGDHSLLLITAIKLLAEGVCVHCCESGAFRQWAAEAVKR